MCCWRMHYFTLEVEQQKTFSETTVAGPPVEANQAQAMEVVVCDAIVSFSAVYAVQNPRMFTETCKE